MHRGPSEFAENNRSALPNRDGIKARGFSTSKLARIQRALESRSAEELKILCAEDGGLLNNSVRAEAWPIILGIEGPEVDRPQKKGTGEFASQIEQDVKRSYNLLEMVAPLQRSSYANRLLKLILGVFDEYDFLSYYQGYHDIAGIVLLVSESPRDANDELAARILKKISLSSLRDHLTPTLDGTLEHLRLLSWLICLEIPELSSKMLDIQMEVPIFSLSWISTWFSHDILNSISRTNSAAKHDRAHQKYGKTHGRVDVSAARKKLEPLLRLFDYIISEGPLAPIYLAAAVVKLGFQKAKLSGLGTLVASDQNNVSLRNSDVLLCDYATLYSYMTSLMNWRRVNQVDTLVRLSRNISKLFPIHSLTKLFNHTNFLAIVKSLSFDPRQIACSEDGKFVLVSDSSSLAPRKCTSIPQITRTPHAASLPGKPPPAGALSKIKDSPEPSSVRRLHNSDSVCSDSGEHDSVGLARELTSSLIRDLEIKSKYMKDMLRPGYGRRMPRAKGHPAAEPGKVLLKSLAERKSLVLSLSFFLIATLVGVYTRYGDHIGGNTQQT